MNEGPTSGILWLPSESYNAAVNGFSEEELNQLDAEQRHHFPPPDRKATLWKYLETYKFENLLKTKTLYLRQVAKLAEAEPNEGRMNQLQEQALIKRFGHNQNDLDNFRSFHTRIRQRSWVTCFSLGDFDEAHMWERFCKQPPNEGVAIKTTYKKLMSSLEDHPLSSELPPFCAMVRYDESANMEWKQGYLLFQKTRAFSDEREVRACVLSPEEEQPAECLRAPVHLPRLIQKIYVHPKASESYMQKVCELAAENLPKNKWRVYRSRLH